MANLPKIALGAWAWGKRRNLWKQSDSRQSEADF